MIVDHPFFCAIRDDMSGTVLFAGVIYDPIRQEAWTAERGAGAYLNNRRIHISKVSRLQESLLCTGFPSRKRHANVNVHFFHQASMASHGVRRTGSAALDLAWVACGRLDGFWEFGLSPWDMAAGTLIVAEAGGLCSDMHGAPHVIGTSPHLLATNGAVHAEILELFSEVFNGHYRVPMPPVA
jgi:myo-inositol-1(or 4)-monophosphatase